MNPIEPTEPKLYLPDSSAAFKEQSQQATKLIFRRQGGVGEGGTLQGGGGKKAAHSIFGKKCKKGAGNI